MADDIADLQWMGTKKNKNKNKNSKRIDEPSFVKLLEGRSVKERQRRSSLRSSCLKSCVVASLLHTLKKEKIDEPSSDFTFIHCEQMYSDAMSIYDYVRTNLETDDIACFALRQNKSGQQQQQQMLQIPSAFKQGNKQRMEQKYQRIKSAECILKENLGPNLHNKLKQKKSAFS